MRQRSVSGLAPSLGPDYESVRDEIVAIVADDLEGVERLFRENLASPTRIVDEIGGYVAEGGGKRIRPMLLLLCTRLSGYKGPHSVLLATVVEFIHCATLIHDDIIDEATTRRGRAAVNRRWGNNVTVLFGDYMFAKAMEMALQAESLDVMRRLADVTLRMTEGEMLQTRYVGNADLSVDNYLDLIERKTAALFSCCCELAGVVAEVNPARREALRGYGKHLGMAFQIVDDLLDYTADTATLGKPAASDLRAGKATLAVLDLMASGSEATRRTIRAAMSGTASDADVGRLTGELHESGAIDRARSRARDHADAALKSLSLFDDGPSRQTLALLPDLILYRDR